MLLTRHDLVDRLAIMCAIRDEAGISPSICSNRPAMAAASLLVPLALSAPCKSLDTRMEILAIELQLGELGL